jgi:hypothetical protein
VLKSEQRLASGQGGNNESRNEMNVLALDKCRVNSRVVLCESAASEKCFINSSSSAGRKGRAMAGQLAGELLGYEAPPSPST